MSGGLGSRLGCAGLVAGVVGALMAGSSGVAAAKRDLGGCIDYELGEAGGPTKCPGWQAAGKNLSGHIFVDADFSGADFTGADLTNAGFANADLSGANFTNANLTGVAAVFRKVTRETQMSGAQVGGSARFYGMVEGQKVAAFAGKGGAHYFILDGVHPGLPSRFRPPAIPKGAFIDECTSFSAVRAQESIKGKPVDVKVLTPGKYVAECTFFTAGRENYSRGRTSFNIDVVDSDPL